MGIKKKNLHSQSKYFQTLFILKIPIYVCSFFFLFNEIKKFSLESYPLWADSVGLSVFGGSVSRDWTARTNWTSWPNAHVTYVHVSLCHLHYRLGFMISEHNRGRVRIFSFICKVQFDVFIRVLRSCVGEILFKRWWFKF